MDYTEDVYRNNSIRTQLQDSLSGATFTDAAWEPCYFGHSEKSNVFIIGTYACMNGNDGSGFWAFSVDDDRVSIKHLYFAEGESTYWDSIAIAKLKYPDLKDLVLD